MADAGAAPQLVTPVASAPEARILAMLEAGVGSISPPPPKQAAQQPAPVAAKTEQVPEQQEANSEPEAPAGPNTQTEGDEAPPEDARRVAEIPIDQLEAIELDVTIKGEDGRDVAEKQTIKALREGYMRQKDYQRKTAEVARQRDAVGESVRQAIQSERNGYQQNLQQMQALLIETVAPELKDVNWNDLAANNAFEYVRLRNRADQISQALSTVQSKQNEVSQKQMNEQKAAKDQMAAQAREFLQTDIPGWNEAHYQTLMRSGEKYGYKAEEVGTWIDPRAIKLLNDAYQFQQLQASPTGKPSADKRVVVPPKVVRPGAASDQTQSQQRQQSAMKRLQGSGRLDDAASVIKARLGR